VRNPGLPVIFITGHSDVETICSGMKARAPEFLPKPFRDHDLRT
jgi:FixJ family two-component response regulator